jgi:hypothetical protein
MKSKRPIKSKGDSKFLYTGKPSELNRSTSSVYAGAIVIIGVMLILAAIYREYFR